MITSSGSSHGNNSRLDRVLSHLLQLQEIGGVRVEEPEFSDFYEVCLFPEATAAQVSAAEDAIGKRLPADFTHFWRCSNGANLFVNDSALHGVGIASTELMAELQLDELELYGAESLRPYAVFARVNGAGDFLAFELETGRVLDGVHAEQPAEWRAIAESFTEWLELFVEARGRYYWIESLYSAEAQPETAG